MVSGLTVEAARSKLKKELSSIYAGISQYPPSVFMELTVTEIRSIQISVIGEVQAPGNFMLPSFSTPMTALYACGGPTSTGTFRLIKLYRNGKQVDTIDVYEFMTQGKFPSSGKLEDGDILVVGAFNKHVELSGRVKIPGVFEVKDDETVAHGCCRKTMVVAVVLLDF